MPVYLPGPCIKRVQAVMFRRHNHLSSDHEWLSIDRPVEWLLPEAGEAGRIRQACDKPSSSSVRVVHGPIGAGQLSRRRCARGERERRDLHRVRWWSSQAQEDLVNLVPLTVKEASEQENNDEHNRQADSPAFCEAA